MKRADMCVGSKVVVLHTLKTADNGELSVVAGAHCRQENVVTGAHTVSSHLMCA